MTAQRKSPFVQRLDQVQKEVAAFLKPLGFKKTGRSLNRLAAEGMVQVVGFQMGQYPIGDYVIPGLRENLYGKFTVNIGVSLPCVLQAEQGKVRTGSFHDYDCEIRARLSAIANLGNDIWWPLDDSTTQTAEALIAIIRDFGLPFFDNYSSYKSVIESFMRDGGFPNQNMGRGALAAAITSWSIGDHRQAQAFFESSLAYADASNHAGFRSHVLDLKNRIGA